MCASDDKKVSNFTTFWHQPCDSQFQQSVWHKIKTVIFLWKCNAHTFTIMHLFFFWFLPGCLSEMSCLCREKLRDSRSMWTEKLACRHNAGTSACMGDIRQHPATVSLHWDVLCALSGKFLSTSKVFKQRLVVSMLMFFWRIKFCGFVQTLFKTSASQ